MTNNATNKVTAVAEDPDDTVEILNGDTPVESGETASWSVGDNTITVTVTDSDDETVKTEYTVTVHRNSSECAITAFAIGEAVGVVDESDHTIAVEVPNGTDVTALTPTITVSTGASVDPASETEGDFTDPVEYTVTAEDGTTTQIYTVTVTEASA